MHAQTNLVQLSLFEQPPNAAMLIEIDSQCHYDLLGTIFVINGDKPILGPKNGKL